MEQFDWDPALETGNAEIDDQHRSLFRLANALQLAIADHADDSDVLTDSIYELTDYCLEHFSAEEELMEACGYPAAGPHRAQHQRLTGETMKLTASFINGEDVCPDTLAPFVASWLRGHIRDEDMRLVAFMRQSAL